MNPFGDYFNRKIGYVLEGKVFRDDGRARQYIISAWGMTLRESQNYLNRLRYGTLKNGQTKTIAKEVM